MDVVAAIVPDMDTDAATPETFTEDEMRSYNPQPCLVCGLPTMQYEFEDTSGAHGLPQPIFRLTGSVCTNADCPTRNGAPDREGNLPPRADPPESDGAVV